MVLLKYAVPKIWGLDFWNTLFLACDNSSDGTGYLRRILVSCAIWRGRWWHWKSQKKNSTDGTWYLRSFFQCVLPITEGTDPPKGEFHYRPCSTQLPISTTRFGTPLLKENILSGKFKWRTRWNLFLKEPISSNITSRGALISELKKSRWNLLL